MSEFRLPRPFVPGSTSVITPMPLAHAPAPEQRGAQAQEALPEIHEFLHSEIPVAEVLAPSVDEFAEADADEPFELPPVEHFLDPLPVVDEFSADEFPLQTASGVSAHLSPPADQTEESGSDWLQAEWQNYDWRAAARLGESQQAEASSAWSETDWDAARPRPGALRQTAAHAIAKALDEIAQRIRDGELAVPSPGAADPATLAATLTALLGMRP